jgi:Type II/IV secretion system protein
VRNHGMLPSAHHAGKARRSPAPGIFILMDWVALAASLAVINELSRNILTVEDPVEYKITGVIQTQVRPLGSA